MSKDPNGPADRDAAERLLRGTPGDPADPLAALLAAAAAPATPRELAREYEALAAFRAARTAPAEGPRHHAAPGRSFGKLFTLRVAAATIAVTGVGGVALAATTGTLPTPLRSRPAISPSTSPSDVEGSESGSPTAGPPTAKAKPGQVPKQDPQRPQSVVGLCRAYTEHSRHDGDRRKLLDTPAFRPLVEAAGNVGEVPKFCRDLLDAQSKATPSPEPRTKNKGGAEPDPLVPPGGTP